MADGSHPAAFAMLHSVLLASPFATAAASSNVSHVSSDEAAAEDSISQAGAAETPAASDNAVKKPAVAEIETRSAVNVISGIRTSTSARQEQDYAIVEAPESLRRPSTALSPDAPTQQELAGAAISGDIGGQHGHAEGPATSLHTKVPAAEASAGQLSGFAPGQRQTRSNAEDITTPLSAGGAAEVTASLEQLRVSGARSGVGGTDTASSTPVSFSSAAST